MKILKRRLRLPSLSRFIIAHPINSSNLVQTKLDIFQMVSLEYLYFVFYFFAILVCSALAISILVFRSHKNLRRSIGLLYLLRRAWHWRNIMVNFFFRKRTPRAIPAIILLLFLLQLLHSLTRSFVLNSFKTSSVTAFSHS